MKHAALECSGRWLGPLMAVALMVGIAGPLTADDRVEFFEKHIRPALTQHCYECHSNARGKSAGDLLLDSRPAMERGGESGKVIEAGRPDESLLVEAIRYESLEMPPGKQLDDETIRLFEEWIRQGAVDPRDEQTAPGDADSIDVEAGRKFWSFRPRENVPIPNPESDWGSSAIDCFILEKLHEMGLEPTEEADRPTWLRRVTFDLIGLPPTVEQLDEFTADQRPDAYERVVDRLLASPHYGERWGRHWLDLARYADTNGADENHKYPEAWRYRDYVVTAFNGDKPYDCMIHEQLAGDLLPAESEVERCENLTATGFLVLGPKMLAEQDKEKLVADIVDEQLDTFGKVFLGLTLGCARCHDHKFDPVTAKDYYALAGVFHSTKTMEHLNHVSQWNERELPVQSHEQDIVANGKSLDPAKAKVMAADESKVTLAALHVRGNHLQLSGDPLPREVPEVLRSANVPTEFPSNASGRLELAQWLTHPDHPLTARVMVNRIWQGHFGQGLVRSPSNFGMRGQPPTHPKLLDWLASEFIRGNWSIKRMHRMIVLSATYRLSGSVSPEAKLVDPENYLLSHFPRRRLELEPIRDALLAIAGELNQQLGGQIDLAKDAKYEESNVNWTELDVPRRTIYLPVNRASLNAVFSTFDYVDPAVSLEQRPTTIVPHQTLFLMNHPLVMETGRRLAARAMAHAEESDARIELIYKSTFARLPTPEERLVAERFMTASIGSPADARESKNLSEMGSDPLRRGQKDSELDSPAKGQTPFRIGSKSDSELAAWTSYCRALLLTSELLYVE